MTVAKESNYSNLCGFTSVYAAAKITGHNISFSEICSVMKIDAGKGVSSEQVQHALFALGVPNRTYKLNDKLEFGPEVAVIACAPPVGQTVGHAFVVRPYGEKFQVIDPPNRPRVEATIRNLNASFGIYVFPPGYTRWDRLTTAEKTSECLFLLGLALAFVLWGRAWFRRRSRNVSRAD